MAKALRVDDAQRQEDGSLLVKLTLGTPPLPGAWTGTSVTIAPHELATMLDNAELEMEADALKLLIFALARWRRLDADLTNGALVRGKTVTFDPDTVGVLTIN